MKTCTSCEVPQPRSAFFRNPRTQDGLGSQCRRCDAAGKRVRRDEKRRALIEAYGGKCTRCGYDKSFAALDFHHRGKDKDFTIGDFLTKPLKLLHLEATKCDLVCANCHRELHVQEAPSYNGRRRN